MSDTGTIQHTRAGLENYWAEGFTWRRYLDGEIRKHRDLWTGVYRKSKIPEWATERLAAMGRDWRFLVLAEDWCGDASNLVPIFARLAEASPHVDLRIVKRDEVPELMDQYVTDGSRSIPVVIVLDHDFVPVARWGPRPAELQELVIGEKRAGLRPSSEIYKDARRRYARDMGETTLRELLEAIAARTG
jgi:hypothetical protein